MNTKLKRLLLPLLRAVKEGRPITFRMRSAARQGLYLIEKPVSLKSKAAKARQRSEKQSSRASHNQETAKIREACLKRSGGYCECGCGAHFMDGFFLEEAEMDHFAGRAVPQTEANCWMLTRTCHRVRTLNTFPVAYWNAKFAAHAAKHGYPVIAHIIHAVPAKAGGAP